MINCNMCQEDLTNKEKFVHQKSDQTHQQNLVIICENCKNKPLPTWSSNFGYIDEKTGKFEPVHHDLTISCGICRKLLSKLNLQYDSFEDYFYVCMQCKAYLEYSLKCKKCGELLCDKCRNFPVPVTINQCAACKHNEIIRKIENEL